MLKYVETKDYRYKTEADRDLCSLVSLGDSEGVGLVLDGLGVDGGAGEGVVGVAKQTQGVDRSFHLETQNHVENKYFSGHEDNFFAKFSPDVC